MTNTQKEAIKQREREMIAAYKNKGLSSKSARLKLQETNAHKYNKIKSYAKQIRDKMLLAGYYLPDDINAEIDAPNKVIATGKDLQYARDFLTAPALKRAARRPITGWEKMTTIGRSTQIRTNVDYNQSVFVLTGESYADYEKIRRNMTKSKVLADYVNKLLNNAYTHAVTPDLLDAVIELVKSQGGQITPGFSNDYIKLPNNFDANYDKTDAEAIKDVYTKIAHGVKFKYIDATVPGFWNKLGKLEYHPYTSEELYTRYMQHRTRNTDELDDLLKEDYQNYNYDADDADDADEDGFYYKFDYDFTDDEYEDFINYIDEIMNSSAAWNAAKIGALDSEQVKENWLQIGLNLQIAEASEYSHKLNSFADKVESMIQLGTYSAQEIANYVDKVMLTIQKSKDPENDPDVKNAIDNA